MKHLTLITAFALAVSGAAMAEGDAAKGARVFKKCAACHAVQEGKRKSGPHLAGILGRPAASVDGFKYSAAMTDAGLTWDEDTLRGFLAAPKKFLPKTKMSFPGIRKEADMDNLIAYLSGL